MTQRDKIGMEALFRRVLPPHKRLGSQFVFRQASAGTLVDFVTALCSFTKLPCKHHASRHVRCLG